MAAAEIADAEGLDNVTMAAVAERVGVRKPSLYNYVDGLPELKSLLAAWGTDQLCTIIKGAAIGRAKHDAIREIADSYREFAHRRPGLYRAILASPDRDNLELKTSLENFMAVLRKVMEPYNLVASDSIHAVRALRSLMHGFVSLEAAGWFAVPLDRDESYHRLIATFLRGLESSS